jgi:tRNA modification GTPase
VLLDATSCRQSLAELPGRPEDRLLAVNKIDVADVPPDLVALPGLVPLSCRTGEGVARLLDRLAELARERLRGGESALVTRARHRVAIAEAVEALDRLLAAPVGEELVLVAEELRIATGAIGRVTGRVSVDELLDRIFARFCVGK